MPNRHSMNRASNKSGKGDVLKGVAETDQHNDLPARPGQLLEPRQDIAIVVWQLGKCDGNRENEGRNNDGPLRQGPKHHRNHHAGIGEERASEECVRKIAKRRGHCRSGNHQQDIALPSSSLEVIDLAQPEAFTASQPGEQRDISDVPQGSGKEPPWARMPPTVALTQPA